MKMKILSIWILTILGLFKLGTPTINAQELIPTDKKIKIGTLENGLTYYIRENKKPENRFELRLALNAGSILENEQQRGLAHFVEHMCFNGTKHFEKNELIQYLETMGIKFGADLNAYTSFDETVYMLSIPSDSAELVDKGFLVMEDWAHNVSFDSVEIDKERGVVIEEWRLGRGPWQRMMDKYIPEVFAGSKYAERLPIGKIEVLENFEHSTLIDFYNTWYRPDLMALVVVGDIDAELAEQKIKEHFSRIAMPDAPKERVVYDVPDNEGTIISITSDKEAPVSVVRLQYKSDPVPEKTSEDYINSYKYNFITGMLNRRIAELNESATPPFVGAGFSYGKMWSRYKDALQGYGVVGDTGIVRGLQVMLEETERIDRYGFTQGELDRYKLDVMRSMEKAYNEREKTESSKYASEYIRNFLEDEPIPGIEYEYNIIKENIHTITLEQVNNLAKELIKDNNRIIVINTPQKENEVIITKEQVENIMAMVADAELQPYEDGLTDTELMETVPVAGKIKKEKAITEIEATELMLSNGIKVLLKPTNFKNDEIRLSAFAWGGTSVYDDNDYYFTATHTSRIIAESGIAQFSKSDLTKLLAGNSARVSTSIGTYSQNISASCRPVDVETMFQLLHLKVTAPRVDEESFTSYIVKNKNLYKNLVNDPNNYFYDKYNRILSQNHPKGNYLPAESDWDRIDYNSAVEIYKDRFADASEFTYVIVGAFDTDSIKPFIETYLASLPSIKRKGTYKDLGIRPPEGKLSKEILKGSDPKSLVKVYLHQEAEFNNDDAFLVSQLGKILSRRYIEVLREEMSGVYGVGASASLSRIPYGKATYTVTIPCSPDNVDSLVFAAINELKDIQTNGPSEKDLTKAIEIYKREKEVKLKENGYWIGAIKHCYRNELDFDRIESFEIVNQITAENIQRVAKQYFNTDEFIKVVLLPEQTTDADAPVNEED